MEQQSLQEHIAWLESQLQQKKQELAGNGEPDKNERELVKEVIQGVGAENIQPPPPIMPIPSAPTSSPIIQPLTNDSAENGHKEIVQQLIEKAIAGDLFSALKAAENLRNPHVLDEFHDTLADHYYEKLIESRKLKID